MTLTPEETDLLGHFIDATITDWEYSLEDRESYGEDLSEEREILRAMNAILQKIIKDKTVEVTR